MFENIVGNDVIKESLKKSIEKDEISNSYMFVGESGIGKKLFAREFAKNIMKTVNLPTESNVDYYEIEPDGNIIKILQIRDLQEKIAEKPINAERKVYVIDEAEKMTEESQNCLLKTLEEPPKYATIILIVSNSSKILETIKSRCIILKFKKLSNDEIRSYIVNSNIVDARKINDEIIGMLNGSLERINNIISDEEIYSKVEKLAKLVKTADLIDVLNGGDILYSSKDNIMDLLNYLNVILLKNRMLNCVEIVEDTKRKIVNNNNFEMSIDNLLIKMWESIHEKV